MKKIIVIVSVIVLAALAGVLVAQAAPVEPAGQVEWKAECPNWPLGQLIVRTGPHGVLVMCEALE